MEILLGLLSEYGMTLVGSIFCIIITQIFKPYTPKRIIPYIPLIASIPITLILSLLNPSELVLTGELVKSLMLDWVKTWMLALGLFDTVVRLFKATGDENVDSDGHKMEKYKTGKE